MKTIRNFLLALCSLLMLWAPQGHAEDIDIYSGGAANGGIPNVLIILDNAASFNASTPGCNYADGTGAASMSGKVAGTEQCALYNTINSLTVNTDGSAKVNLGLMVYSTTGIASANPAANCAASNDGGCLLRALTPMDATGKAAWLAMVKAWDTSNIQANNQGNAMTMQEAWAYYAGTVGASGRNYSGVKPGAGCQKNFVIYLGNAYRNNTTPGDNGSPSGLLAAAPPIANTTTTPNPDTNAITIPSGTYGLPADPTRLSKPAGFSCGFGNPYSMPSHTNTSGLFADEWARYMKATDIFGTIDDSQGITTYTIGALGTTCNAQYPALLSSMATAGGGKYFPTDADSVSSISDAISQILNEIQSVNSVFASASLPVSVNSEGTFLNQIFLGMFRPDASAAPRWVGNLKQFQLVRIPSTATTGPLVLGDANLQPAISSAGTGFIKPSSVSFWTYKTIGVEPDLSGGFFKNNPLGTSTNAAELAALAYDSADGEVVEKGGAAQQIRKAVLTATYPSTLRNIYTYCPSGTGCVNALTDSSNAFTVANTAVLSSTPSLNPSTITRSGAVATMTTPSAHNFIVGDSVTVTGAVQSDYNGTKTVLTTPTATTFTFAVNDFPPFPATGSYTASAPGTPNSVTLARAGTTVTATSTAHGYANGDTISIAGANQGGYNGSFVIVGVTANTFTYQVIETPVSPAGGGTVKKNSPPAAPTFSIDTVANSGVIRAAGSVTVTVKTTAAHGYAVNNQVTLASVKDAAGNLIPEYNASQRITSVPSTTTFRFDLLAAQIAPATPATGTITASKVATVKIISLLTRVGATATATVAAHGFANGTTVAIAGTAGANESAYLGSYTIANVTANTFDYTVTLSPVSPATGSITVTKVGVSNRTSLINWVRGEDNVGDERGPGGSVTVRPSVHGDVLHSRPAVINYVEGSGGINDKLVVFYGSNDGLFRAINGSQTDSIGSVPPGGELWSLVLSEHYGKLNRQRINAPELAIPPSASVGSLPKDYFVDGSTGIFQKLNSSGNVAQAFLYLTMRRGGRFIYAIDVTNPVSPQFMWKISSSDLTNLYTELGQTWSRPRVTVVNGYVNPVLIFGGGYAPTQDNEPPTTDAMGRAIYVLDATTGALIWKATATTDLSSSCTTVGAAAAVVGPPAIPEVPSYVNCKVPEMKYAIPSEVTFKDRDSDGFVDRLYAGDVGGNMWRVDFVTSLDGLAASKSNVPANWRVTKLAALGCETGAPPCIVSATQLNTTPRKFFFPPSAISVGATSETIVAGSFDALVLGSGDREHPLISSGSQLVSNRFYMIKDDVTSAYPQRSGTDLAGITGVTLRTELTLFQSFKSVPISAYQRVTQDVMTITTAAAHGFIKGLTVVVDGANPASLDGHYTLTSVPTSTTYTYTSVGAAGASAAASGKATTTKFLSATLANFQRAATDVMTVTTSVAHNFLRGQTVVIANSTPSLLDGTYTITAVPSATTFRFASAGAVTASASAIGDATVSVPFDKNNTAPGFYGYLALGEKAVNAPVTVSGTAFFGTNRPVVPSANTCVSNLGQARGYAFSPFTGAVSSVVFDGGGLPPSPVAGVVDVDNTSGTDFQRFCIGCGGANPGGGGGSSSLENTDPFLDVPKKPQRTYWYRR